MYGEKRSDAEARGLASEEEKLRQKLKALIRQMDQQENEFQEKEDVLKQVVALLLVLSRTAVDHEIVRLLDRLKQELKKGVHRPTLESLLWDIKERVGRQDEPQPADEPTAAPQQTHTPPQPAEQAAKAQNKRRWSVWRTKVSSTSEQSPTGQPAHEAEFEGIVRSVLETILDHLRIDSQPALNQQISQILAVTQEAALLSRLSEVQQQLGSLLKDYRHLHAAERAKAAEVLKEVASRLAEVEKTLVLPLLVNHQESTSNNVQFIELLEHHVADMQEAAQLKDLQALRQMITDWTERMQAAVQAKREFDAGQSAAFEAKICSLEQQLQEANQRLSSVAQRASHDPLLEGVYNRLAFTEKLEQEIQRFQRYHQPCSLILFDVDHFKQVNDTYGHQAGDQVLKILTTRVKYALRGADFFARYGGDELIIVLPQTPMSAAKTVASRLCTLVHSTQFVYEGQVFTVTISVGVATVQPEETVETLLERADQALYLAKVRGRNQVRTEREVADSPARFPPARFTRLLRVLAKALPVKKSAVVHAS